MTENSFGDLHQHTFKNVIKMLNSQKQSVLFSPLKIGYLMIPNRFMRSATFMHGADSKGFPKKWLLDYYVQLSKGKIGLITTGYMFAEKRAKAIYGQCGMLDDSHADAWKSTIQEIHKEGSKIVFQLADAGKLAAPFVTSYVRRGVVRTSFPFAFEMTEKEIKNLVRSFAEAAARLEKVGADGVQLHCAHGYHLSTFLSPVLNKRKDKYGGNHDNRIRIIQEIVDEIRSVTKPSFLVSAKLNGDDCMEYGVTPEECAATLNKLRGIDLFEISCGIPPLAPSRFNRKFLQMKKYPFKENYNFETARIIRKLAPNKNIAVVGGIRKFKDMEKAIKDGTTDLISMSRPFIKEPDLVLKMMNGRKTSRCCSCGKCLTRMFGTVKCWTK